MIDTLYICKRYHEIHHKELKLMYKTLIACCCSHMTEIAIVTDLETESEYLKFARRSGDISNAL